MGLLFRLRDIIKKARAVALAFLHVSMVVFIAAALVLFQAKSLTFTKRLDVLFKDLK